MTATARVVGIDPSLTSAGVAVIDRTGVVTLRSFGATGKRTDTVADRSLRIVTQAQRILAHVRPDDALVVIEGPALGLNNPGTWDRAGLWWGIVAGCRSRGVPVAVCAPQTRAKWATGSGRADKVAVIAAMRALWPDLAVRNDDQADALTMASIGAVRLAWNLPQLAHRTESVAAVAWPQEVPA